MARKAHSLAAALMVLLFCGVLGAQPKDMERARELFDRGLAEMLAGNYPTGCPLLAQSYEMSELPGALFTLAECEAKWGKLATALVHYREYLTLYVRMPPDKRTKQQERKKVAAEQVEALEGAVPRLTIVMPRDAPVGAVVTLDGQALPSTQLGAAVPVDPGVHRVSVRWPDGQSQDFSEQVSAAERRQLAIPAPAARPTGAGAGGAGAGDGSGGDSGSAIDGDAMRIGAFVAGGVGIAGLLVGIITGGAAIGTKDGIDEHCVETVCTQEGKDAADTTQALGNVSTVGFVVGGVGLAAGTLLWFLAPPSEEEPSATAAGVSVRPIIAVTPGTAPSSFWGLAGSW